MPTQHPLSPCCGAKIYAHSSRRRQCSDCRRTWTKHEHKRGRDPNRINLGLVERLVLKTQTVKEQSQHFPGLSDSAIEKRFVVSLKHFVGLPRVYPDFSGEYVLLADGLWFSFDDEDWVLYLFLLKPRRRNYAYLLDPIMIRGGESFDHWREAIDSLPESIRERINGFVSDNFRASDRIARHYGWQHQLCHFHLLKELQRRRGRRKVNLPGRAVRECMYQFIRRIISSSNPAEVKACAKVILAIADRSDCPKKLAMMGRECLKVLNKYHTYASFPELTLPRTNNACESLVKCLSRRTSQLRTPKAVEQWAVAYARLKRTMVCNGDIFPHN